MKQKCFIYQLIASVLYFCFSGFTSIFYLRWRR